MPSTTNFNWTTPADTDLVKDGAAAIRTLGNGIDTSLVDLKGGTTGQFLSKATNTDLDFSWSTPISGGMTLINTGGTTLTGASVVINSIPGTYNSLLGYVLNFKPATDGSALIMRLNADSTANRYFNTTATATLNTAFDTTSIALGIGQDNSVATGITIFEIPQYANTTTQKYVSSQCITNHQTTTTNLQMYVQNGLYNQTGAITSITLLPDAGNFTSGTLYLYGVK